MPASSTAPVLVLDDDPSIRQTIGWALQDEGLPVQLARDAYEGLDQVRAQRPALVVLDIGLPGMDGRVFADHLHEMHNAVPILVITADGRAEEKARRVGAFDYMEKPFDVEELIAAVRQGLGQDA